MNSFDDDWWDDDDFAMDLLADDPMTPLQAAQAVRSARARWKRRHQIKSNLDCRARTKRGARVHPRRHGERDDVPAFQRAIDRAARKRTNVIATRTIVVTRHSVTVDLTGGHGTLDYRCS